MISLLQTSGTRTSVRTRTYELETAEADIDAKACVGPAQRSRDPLCQFPSA